VPILSQQPVCSTTTRDVRDDLKLRAPSPNACFQLPNGDRIADDFNDLLDGSLDTNIGLTASGAARQVPIVYGLEPILTVGVVFFFKKSFCIRTLKMKMTLV
jgi:hypothetical protein